MPPCSAANLIAAAYLHHRQIRQRWHGLWAGGGQVLGDLVVAAVAIPPGMLVAAHLNAAIPGPYGGMVTAIAVPRAERLTLSVLSSGCAVRSSSVPCSRQAANSPRRGPSHHAERAEGRVRPRNRCSSAPRRSRCWPGSSWHTGGVLALAGALALALVAIVAARPQFGAYLFLLANPLIVGIARGDLVPILRLTSFS